MSKYDDLVEETVVINESEYILQPQAYKSVFEYFGNDLNYNKLNEKANHSFTRTTECIETPLISEHKITLPNLLDKSLCQSLIEEFINDPEGIQDPRVLTTILPEIITPELDQQVISYFQSEYCIFWWSIYEVEADMIEEGYFTKWHCDGGPENHLKVIIYLNDFEEHGSDTGFLAKESTDQLKEVGYIFNNINNRVLDISEICQHYNIDFSPSFGKPATGDCFVFNPTQIAHVATSPKPGKTRYVINLCLVQSAANWRDVIENYYIPEYDCIKFNEFADVALRFEALNNHQNKLSDPEYALIPLSNEINNLQHIEYILQNIFSEFQIKSYLYQYFVKSDPHLINCRSIFQLVNTTKKLLNSQISNDKALPKVFIQGLLELADFEAGFKDSFNRYNTATKPKPTAVFWPNPDHPKYPQSKYQEIPYVNQHPIMDMNTPIGSAGSCFAFEIAKFFQQEGYNYVVTERNDDPNSGVIVDGYQPGDKHVKFCANYGILFNTPSFLQLAEKAFGIKRFDKLLVDSSNGYYLDPYRENVVFSSPEAYLEDYPKHVAAVRNSFLQSEVFVVTLGLNECWQLHDGSFMSRNPRENMFQLVKHRTLTVAENVDNIQRFFDIIKAHNPDFKLIISVSPIPFLATGRGDEHHIITANCHSKAVLRVAAEELVASNADMYYLPSYELVTECIEDGWENDHRHVKPETVKKVVGMFQDIFVRD